MAQVRGGDNLLGERDAIIFEEDELESAFDIRVGVDDTTDRRDQFDDLLRDVIALINRFRKTHRRKSILAHQGKKDLRGKLIFFNRLR